MTAIVTIPKSTFPFVSIPQPGKRPFVYERKKFTAVLRGINITDWSLSDCGEWLEVTHSTRGVRGRYKFRNQLYVISAYDFRRKCSDWREAEQRRRKATPVVGIAGQVIRRKLTEGTAYKQIRALGYPLTIQSKLGKRESEEAIRNGYWAHVYLYCGLSRASHWDRRPVDELKACIEHYSRRIEWLNQKRQREALVGRIEAIKAIQLPVEGIQ